MFSQTLTPRQQTDRLRSVKGAELPVDLTYTYTPRSQIASINDQTVPNIDQTFTYDGIGRLTASTGPWGAGTFQYDGLGNLRQRSVGARTVAMSYDAANRLSSHTDTAGAARSLGYDSRGNVTSLGRLSFVYDASDQLVQTLDGGPPPGTVPASDGVIFDGTVPRVQKRAAMALAPVTVAMSAVYDGAGRRVKSVAGLTRYSVYDASGTLIEIDEVGGAKTDYIRAAGMTLARIAGSTVTWLHHDHLGSAVAGTNSAGAVVWRESEQPFGEDWTSAAANDNQAGYTGHVEDAATGLTYMQARYYDPVIGRFLSIDPVGFTPKRPDMFNRYAYAANDPVNKWDPDGLSCQVTTSKKGKEKAECKIDQIVGKDGKARDATKADRKNYKAFEKAYSKAVTKLLSDKTASTEVNVPSADGKGEMSFTASAGELAQQLVSSNVTAVPASPGGVATSAPGMNKFPGQSIQSTVRYVGAAALAGAPAGRLDRGFDGNVGVMLVHDAMHNPGPDRVLGIGMEEGRLQQLHQDPFNDAAARLLGY